MSAKAESPVNLIVLGGGIGLMLAGYGLYRFFSPSPHGYLEIFIALPVFCLGVAVAGAAFLTDSRGRFRPARLIIGWALILLAVSPALAIAWALIQ